MYIITWNIYRNPGLSTNSISIVFGVAQLKFGMVSDSQSQKLGFQYGGPIFLKLRISKKWIHIPFAQNGFIKLYLPYDFWSNTSLGTGSVTGCYAKVLQTLLHRCFPRRSSCIQFIYDIQCFNTFRSEVLKGNGISRPKFFGALSVPLDSIFVIKKIFFFIFHVVKTNFIMFYSKHSKL